MPLFELSSTAIRSLERVSTAGYDHQVGIAVPLRTPEPTGLLLLQEDA